MRRPDVLLVCSSYYRNTPREARMALIACVAEAHGVTVAEVMGNSRGQRIANARKAAMRAVWEKWGDSSPMIGRLFNRDHTTVLSALGRISKRNAKSLHNHVDNCPECGSALDVSAAFRQTKTGRNTFGEVRGPEQTDWIGVDMSMPLDATCLRVVQERAA